MRIGWIAVRGDKASVLERLGLVEGDRPAQLFRDPCVGISPDGWVIVVKPDPAFVTAERLAKVSEGAEALGYWGCTVVMATGVLQFRDGRQLWSVEHNGEDGDVDHLEVVGDPHGALETLVAEARKAQADDETDQVDFMFDVTEKLAAAGCGFNIYGDFDFTFTALAGPPKKPGLFSRLFGKQ